jgi:hypothetical protein
VKTTVTVDLAYPVKLVLRGARLVVTPFVLLEQYAAQKTIEAAVTNPKGQAKLAEILAAGVTAAQVQKAQTKTAKKGAAA